MDKVGYDDINSNTCPNIPPEFKTLLDNSSITQKKWMLIALRESMKVELAELHASQSNIDFSQYVEKIDNFVPNDFFEDALLAEVKDLGLIKNSVKPLTQWLSCDSRAYCFSDKKEMKHDAKDISSYPAICDLWKLVNEESRTTQDANSALVIVYNSKHSSIDFHDDNESLIDNNSSISTITFGSTRDVEFCSHSLRPRRPQHVLSCGNHDMMIMKPGCQEKLVHRVRRGKHISLTDKDGDWRIAISFRKLTVHAEYIEKDPDISFNVPKSLPKRTVSSSRVTVIAGDSHAVGLDPVRLGKMGRKRVINLSSGGSSIDEVALQFDTFFLSDRDKNDVVDKVIVCVGTNDIRNCRGNGVKHLKGPLIGLIDQIKMCFPEASIWFQSLIPLPIQHQFCARNVEQFNNLLYNLCSFKCIFLLDVFKKFLTYDRRSNLYFRNNFFFINSYNNIHLNKIGMSVLAREYIRIIHSNRFNPLGY